MKSRPFSVYVGIVVALILWYAASRVVPVDIPGESDQCASQVSFGSAYEPGFESHGRSASWPKVRAEYLLKNPECIACGGEKNLNVHHIISFRVDPSLELEPSNLCTLCTKSHFGGINCHFAFGHNFNWTCRNPNVIRDAAGFKGMIEARLCSEAKKTGD